MIYFCCIPGMFCTSHGGLLSIFVHRTQEKYIVSRARLQNDEKRKTGQKTLSFPWFYAIMLAETNFSVYKWR